MFSTFNLNLLVSGNKQCFAATLLQNAAVIGGSCRKAIHYELSGVNKFLLCILFTCFVEKSVINMTVKQPENRNILHMCLLSA